MKKLILITCAATLAFAGCKSVSVSTADWSASYWSFGQENDVKGLKVKAGDDVTLEIEQTKSHLDPAVQDALRTAAAALAAAANACEACATGGASEIIPAVTSAASGSCPGGACEDK